MNKYALILFDLDGTLVDTSEGIINCHKRAHIFSNKPVPPDDALFNVIGGPLLKTYTDVFSFSEDEAVKAVEEYRREYKEKGVYECRVYDGIKETLSVLKSKGYKLGVATLKAEYLANILLKHVGIADFFDTIRGVDTKDTLTKSDLINICISVLGADKNTTLLVGDSIHDYRGAKKAGVGIVAATYGFGFKNKETDNLDLVSIIAEPLDLLKLL